jgi:hypothetical protein
MAKTIGVVLTIAFLTASLIGTLASAWILADVAAPEHNGSITTISSTRIYLLALAVLAEGLRLVLSLHGERIWRRSSFQGAAFAFPLWLVCTAYCTLVPTLTLAAMDTVRAAAPSPASGKAVFPAGFVPQPVASAGDLLQTLTHLADMPEGSKLAEHGRIDANREIVMSQGALAALVGRSKPTVRRWLRDLESQQLILRSAAGKATRIRLQPRLHATNGDARH